MTIKPFPSLRVLLGIIVFLGLALDSYSVNHFWQQLNDSSGIQQILIKNELPIDNDEINGAIATAQSSIGLVLILFLLWDFIAYYFLYRHKNWARRYVLSIAIFYLLSCIFEFSFMQYL